MSITLKSFVQSSKALSGLLKPVASMYANAAAYQKLGTLISIDFNTPFLHQKKKKKYSFQSV